MTGGQGLIFRYAGAADWALAPTKGLVPYRRPRGRADVAEDADQAVAWAKAQPWYPRVRATRCDVRWWTWFVEPATDAELEVLRSITQAARR